MPAGAVHRRGAENAEVSQRKDEKGRERKRTEENGRERKRAFSDDSSGDSALAIIHSPLAINRQKYGAINLSDTG
jgi:hypothetical protein